MTYVLLSTVGRLRSNNTLHPIISSRNQWQLLVVCIGVSYNYGIRLLIQSYMWFLIE